MLSKKEFKQIRTACDAMRRFTARYEDKHLQNDMVIKYDDILALLLEFTEKQETQPPIDNQIKTAE